MSRRDFFNGLVRENRPTNINTAREPRMEHRVDSAYAISPTAMEEDNMREIPDSGYASTAPNSGNFNAPMDIDDTFAEIMARQHEYAQSIASVQPTISRNSFRF